MYYKMSEAKLKQIAQDVAFIKQKIVSIEEEIDSIYRIRPKYLKKLSRIEREKAHSYSSIDELRKDLEK